MKFEGRSRSRALSKMIATLHEYMHRFHYRIRLYTALPRRRSELRGRRMLAANALRMPHTEVAAVDRPAVASCFFSFIRSWDISNWIN
jgi:hypothetical protein